MRKLLLSLAVMLRSSQYRGLSCVENVVSQIFVVFQRTVPSFVDVFRQIFDIFSIYIVFPTKYGEVLASQLNSTMIFNQKSYRCNKNKKYRKNRLTHIRRGVGATPKRHKRRLF